MSVDLAKLTTPQESVNRSDRPGRGIGALQARTPRSLGFEVFHDPIDGNYAHSAIQGDYKDRVKCDQLFWC
jgi:hypothetical protein